MLALRSEGLSTLSEQMCGFSAVELRTNYLWLVIPLSAFYVQHLYKCYYIYYFILCYLVPPGNTAIVIYLLSQLSLL